jgi:mono/diheme cytochrome c family protein
VATHATSLLRLIAACSLALGLATLAAAASLNARLAADNLTFHGTPQRTGWYAGEHALTPAALRSGHLGMLWESAPLRSFGDTPARLFASPLYVENVPMLRAGGARAHFDIVYAASTTGSVAAINASARNGVPAGSTLWTTDLTSSPCARGTNGILSTPVIDRNRQRLYVAVCDSTTAWRIHALALGTGAELPGWPVALDAAVINRAGVNANGRNQFPSGVVNFQRGALNLTARGTHLLVTFGGEPNAGWLLAIDTRNRAISSAFSVTPRTAEGVGGLWSSGGAAIAADGQIYLASGSSVLNALAKMGNAGVFPESAGNWSQSILRLSLTRTGRLQLTGTYTPFNYCQAGGQDLDLGAGTPIAIDLPRAATSTPKLLFHGGSKQGNVYLLDRHRMPGSLVQRQPCATEARAEAANDRSLLAPEIQPQFGTRGPLNVFGPYSDDFGMGNLAKSRSTPAYFQAASGRHYVFATGSAKAAIDSGVSVAPGIARLEIVTAPGAPAHLRLDATHPSLVFQNPGAPVVSSNGPNDAVVWVLDINKPRSASLYGADAPKPVLYALDASSLELLWQSAPSQLFPSGKYNEPVVARGRVFVGTDRIQAFGLLASREAALASVRTATPEVPRDDTQAIALSASLAVGERLYGERCGTCHDLVRPDVPSRAALQRQAAQAIIDKMRTGTMQAPALGLNDADIAAIAAWLVTPSAAPPR